jgi:hypothetical protein
MSETEAADHPALGFDDVIHQRTRLGILSVLAEADRADFGYLKSTLKLTDGNLGRHARCADGVGRKWRLPGPPRVGRLRPPGGGSTRSRTR